MRIIYHGILIIDLTNRVLPSLVHRGSTGERSVRMSEAAGQGHGELQPLYQVATVARRVGELLKDNII